MKSDFLLAITQLSAEKNLPKEVVLRAVESALVSAYRKDNFASNQNITVKINPNTGKVEVWAEKVVVETPPQDPRREIPLEAARRLKDGVQPGEMVMVEVTLRNAGRIAAQTAKQVILQRLHEAEHSAILEEFTEKEGSIVTGTIQRIEPSKQIFVDLGRTEAILPVAEQMRSERYRVGQRLKVYLLEVARTSKGPRMVVSRSHPNLLRRLFELEIPEVLNGTVEIKSVAREAGYRSKVAVTARQERIDPVGSCVGLRGIRIQNIVNELGGEKIDVVQWAASPATFIANALSPAQVVSVSLNEAEKTARVVILDRQLSLAIGKEGQNVRLAAKLTDWRIDIKSATAAEAEKQAAQVETAKESAAVAEAPVEMVSAKAEPVVVVAETLVSEPSKVETAAGVTEEAKVPVRVLSDLVPVGVASEKPVEEVVEEEILRGTPVSLAEPAPRADTAKGQIRFAEDILGFRPNKPTGKLKKVKKKKTAHARSADEEVRIKGQRRGGQVTGVDEDI